MNRPATPITRAQGAKGNNMNYDVLKNQITRRILLVAWTTALAVGFMVSLPQPANAQTITPPPVPDGIGVEAGNEAFLLGRGVGTQNYVCSPCDPTKPNCPSGVAFTLFTPQATLFDAQEEQLTTHFFSPNPLEPGIIRATWQDSRDTSTVWASLVKSATVRTDSIPWLLLNVKDTGTQAGPTGGDRLTKTTFIQRLNTSGGLAPSTGCLSSFDLGHQAFLPYKADYFFYKKRQGRQLGSRPGARRRSGRHNRPVLLKVAWMMG
ncbi:MAG TPA: DUF3455 domain-containing protein [Pyrinomonadaceae bacterium]|nr:DUF3455 domain-containing protein [Pyrinomonadaceae bacterium]